MSIRATIFRSAALLLSLVATPTSFASTQNFHLLLNGTVSVAGDYPSLSAAEGAMRAQSADASALEMTGQPARQNDTTEVFRYAAPSVVPSYTDCYGFEGGENYPCFPTVQGVIDYFNSHYASVTVVECKLEPVPGVPGSFNYYYMIPGYWLTPSCDQPATDQIADHPNYYCPSGYELGFYYQYYCSNSATAVITATSPNAKNNGCDDCRAGRGNAPRRPTATDPINLATGNVYLSETDYRGSGPDALIFRRYYNSYAVVPQHMGDKWTHEYDGDIENHNALTAYLDVNDGRTLAISQSSGVSQYRDPDVPGSISSANGYNDYYVHSATDDVKHYQYFPAEDRFHLVSITDRAGRVTQLSYDSRGHLLSVTNAFGRSLTFTYDAGGHVATLTDPDGGLYTYAYDANNNLVSATYPDGKSRQYLYENTTYVNALTGIIDENGNRYVTWTYDADGRAVANEHAGGADKTTLAYNADGTTTVVEPLGQVRTYHLMTQFGLVKATQIDGGPCPACGSRTQAIGYDANGFIASRTDFNGNVTTYANDSRGLQTSRTEAAGTPQQRTITTAWDANFRLPTQISEPSKTTSFVYDSRGLLTRRTETDTASGVTRTWSYTYTPEGLLASVDGPRTDVNDVTRYAYDTQGNLVSTTNALGQMTSITAHDASGRPLALVDANGLNTTLTYDARGRLLTRNAGGEVTTFAYDAAGELTRITLPDARYLAYGYDAAHRLVSVTDQLGNHLDDTLDAAGNRTREDVHDAGGTLVRTRSHVYNQLSRLVQDVGAASQTTAYAYDANGNRVSITDANTQPTTQAFDTLNRLTQVTDPLNGVVAYGYDSRDRITSVTDADGHTTTYSYDGLGNRTATVSPDTGTTTYAYDAAGNVVSQTDAKGQTTTYQYDALNRVTLASYADGSTVSYTYDAAPNGIGRLASIADVSGETRFTYDAHGRVTSRVQTVGTLSFALTHTYDAVGRLASMTYPSTGDVVEYGYTNGLLTSLTLNGQLLLGGITYQPFGPVSGWTWGNGTPSTRGFDTDGHLVSYSLPGETRNLTYDPVGNITAVTGPSVMQRFGYDAIDRLTAANDASFDLAYTYDANGNRLSLRDGTNTTTYGYATDSNRLLSLAGATSRTHHYDANGNLTSDGTHSYTYDVRNRLVSVDGGAAIYMLNGLGQRVEKQANGATVMLLYDLDGHLIAEADASGAVQREYVYLGDTPVAVEVMGQSTSQAVDEVIDNSGTGVAFNGTWAVSTAIAGYEGANYQVHAANGPSPQAVVVDNGGAGFSTTGTWTASTAISGYEGADYQVHAANGVPPGGIALDNTDTAAVATGTWTGSTAIAGYQGANYQAHAAGTAAEPFTWTLTVPQDGDYQVYANWTAYSNRATNATYTVHSANGDTPVVVNQQVNGGQWNQLGTFTFTAGTARITLSDAANGYVIADAVELVPAGAPPNTATWTPAIAQDGDYDVFAKWSANPNRASNATYTVVSDTGATPVTVNQQFNGGQWNKLGTFHFTASGAHRIELTDQANGYVIADAVAIAPAGALANSVTWTPSLPGPGRYQVYAKWSAYSNRATNATYTVYHTGGSTPVTVNQQFNGGQWNLLGTFDLDSASRIVLTDQADGYVIADALRIVGTAGSATPSGVYYVHTDQLGTPRAISDSTDTAIWRWDPEPFGTTAASEDPDGDGQLFTFNLRFPGQYYDDETGMHYNYFRDYDPSTGRYIESDPIGLGGGLNTYAYVQSNPLSSFDIFGLEPGDVCGECSPGSTDCLLYGGNICFPAEDVSIKADRYPVYGNWCGPTWTGGHEGSWDDLTPGQQKDAKPPIDGLDRACMNHDICYSSCRKDNPCDSEKRSQCFAKCDAVLRSKAYQAGGFYGRLIGKAMARKGRRAPDDNARTCPQQPNSCSNHKSDTSQ